MTPTDEQAMNDAQIKHMVDRFLMWKLPENFSPDGGINFEPLRNKGTEYEHRREPIGTNLLDATQAEAMIRYLIEGLPAALTRDDAYAEGFEDAVYAAALDGLSPSSAFDALHKAAEMVADWRHEWNENEFEEEAKIAFDALDEALLLIENATSEEPKSS